MQLNYDEFEYHITTYVNYLNGLVQLLNPLYPLIGDMPINSPLGKIKDDYLVLIVKTTLPEDRLKDSAMVDNYVDTVYRFIFEGGFKVSDKEGTKEISNLMDLYTYLTGIEVAEAASMAPETDVPAGDEN